VAASFTFIVQFDVKAGHGDRLAQALLDCVAPSLAEEGCLAYRPYADLADANAYMVVERWKDDVALTHHRTTGHFVELQRILDEVLTRPCDVDMLVDSDESPPAP
jgi:quinol monooxygenase YgiN